MKVKEQVAINIRRIRLDKKLSQKQLADLCGFQSTYVTRLENVPQNLTIRQLEIIAQAFSVPVAALFLSDKITADLKKDETVRMRKEVEALIAQLQKFLDGTR